MDKLAEIRMAAMFDELIKLGYSAPLLRGPAIGRVAAPTPPPSPSRSGISGKAIESIIGAVPNQKPTQPKPEVTTPNTTAIKSNVHFSPTTSAPSAPKSAPAPKAPSVPKPGSSNG